MMKRDVTAQAFLELMGDISDWDLPKEYRRALDPFINGGMELYVPWPSGMIPSAGSEIRFSNIPRDYIDHMAVRYIEYFYTAESGGAAHIGCVIEEQCKSFDLYFLLCVSDEGFLIGKNKKGIKDILKEAGLLSTAKDYKEINPK